MILNLTRKVNLVNALHIDAHDYAESLGIVIDANNVFNAAKALADLAIYLRKNNCYAKSFVQDDIDSYTIELRTYDFMPKNSIADFDNYIKNIFWDGIRSHNFGKKFYYQLLLHGFIYSFRINDLQKNNKTESNNVNTPIFGVEEMYRSMTKQLIENLISEHKISDLFADFLVFCFKYGRKYVIRLDIENDPLYQNDWGYYVINEYFIANNGVIKLFDFIDFLRNEKYIKKCPENDLRNFLDIIAWNYDTEVIRYNYDLYYKSLQALYCSFGVSHTKVSKILEISYMEMSEHYDENIKK